MNPIKQGITFYKVRRDWFGEGGKPVPPQQAQERANVCLNKCPMNRRMNIWEIFAGAAAIRLRNTIEAKNKLSLHVEGEKDLHVCSACKCFLPVKVWTPLKFIRESTPLEDLHPDCWILSENRNLQDQGIK